MPRFVLLRHDWPTVHFDLLLENGATLRSWRLASQPVQQTPIAVESMAAHRLRYLDYEGPVSGGRGSVTRVFSGTFEVLQESPERLELAFDFGGERWRGVIAGPAGGMSEQKCGVGGLGVMLWMLAAGQSEPTGPAL